MPRLSIVTVTCISLASVLAVGLFAADDVEGVAFFEKQIRPILVQHCYECHSETAQEQQGGLLLDRRSGWLRGGKTEKAVVPGQPNESLLVKAVRYTNSDLQMPPENKLPPDKIALLEQWIFRGAPGPADDLGATAFSRLGDQEYLFERAKDHWAFQAVRRGELPSVIEPKWNQNAIDRFVFAGLAEHALTPSREADPRTMARRLFYDLTGLLPTVEQIEAFQAASAQNPHTALVKLVDQLLGSLAFGEQFARMWLDVARYADTDSFYRPDTKTPHYFPFAFTYRDYVIDALNRDKPYAQFIREQLAADLMGFAADAPELAALGFLTVGPHANRAQEESIDDWIDLTTRGLLGLTAACARCHDHKYEPIPTADYYALQGVFASTERSHPLDEQNLPILHNYSAGEEDRLDYELKRAAVDAKIAQAGNATIGGNALSVAQKIRDTELARLLLFHPGAPVHTMVVKDRSTPVEPVVFLRGDPANPGQRVPRRILKIIDPEQRPFPADASGRLQLADHIVDPNNPLTARVLVNRVWGRLMGSYLVETPSDFGLQGAQPTHPELLDWLASDFMSHDWSIKRLVRTIVLSKTYGQRSDHRNGMAAIDPTNRRLWRAYRKPSSIEAIRDSLLAVAGQLDRSLRGRPAELWGDNYTRRRAIYGYINRFNLDPTLRVFDFPTPMQTQSRRGESIVAPQSLFTMNAPFIIDQAIEITELDRFQAAQSDDARIAILFRSIFQRDATTGEVNRISRFLETQQRFFKEPTSSIKTPWPLVAQSLLMSNEFQYID